MGRENRQKQRNDANQETAQAPDQPQGQEPLKSRGPSQLGKEAKIGVAVILALVVVLVVVAIVRFTGSRTTGPVATAAQDKAKPGSANKGKHHSDSDPGRSRHFDGAGTTVVPANTVPAAPPKGSSAEPWKSDFKKHDADPIADSGFPPLLAGPTNSKPTVIERPRAASSAPPPSDDPFHRRPSAPAASPAPNPLRGKTAVPAASNLKRHDPPRVEPPKKDDDRYGLNTAPPPPTAYRNSAPRDRDRYAPAGDSPVPPVHRERGRYDDFGTERGDSGAASSYRDPPPERDPPPFRASAAGMRREYQAGRAYTVVEGETLFTIARYELGKASRWVEIYELNGDALGRDFNNLKPGTRLRLPANEKPDVLAEPPSSVYRRR